MSRAASGALAALLALAALAPRPAAAGVRPRYGGALRVLIAAPPAELDPARAVAPADLQAVRAAHATLLDADAEGRLHPALLEELPEAEDGGRVWRLRLAPGLRFHDGAPLGAAEVAASLARLAGPGAAHGWLVSPVQGAADVHDGRAIALSGVKVVGERELRITLAYPFPAFPQALAALPSAVVRYVPGAAVGAGPFRPAGATAGGLRLEAFDAFCGGRPFADALLLAAADARAAARALRAGDAEIALRAEPAGPVRLEGPPLGLVVAVVSRRLGSAAAPTRAALASLDRADLARFARGPAAPLAGLLPAAVLPAPPVTPPPAGGAPAPQLRLLVPEGPDAPRAAAARIQVKLYDRGVRVAVETADPATFAARLASGDFDAALAPVWLVSSSPALALAQVAAALGGPEAGARALARAAAAPDAAALAAQAAGLEGDLLAAPLYATGLRAAARDGVEGLALHADGTLELGDAWLLPAAPAPAGGRP